MAISWLVQRQALTLFKREVHLKRELRFLGLLPEGRMASE
jgi:hypothetical protein